MRVRDYKVSYRDDIKIFQTVFIKSWMVTLLILLCVLPFFFDIYFLHLAVLAGISIIGAHGINLTTGYCGQISIGHAGFVAIGAYSSALLCEKTGVPFLVAMPIAGLFASMGGLLVGVPSLRLRGLYIAVTTFAFGFIVEHFIVHLADLTGGAIGMDVSSARIGSLEIDNEHRFYFLVLSLVILSTIYAKNITRSRIGRAFIAIRDKDIAARLLGVELTRYKLMAFALGAFYGGIAGSLYAHYIGFIGPEHFTLMLSIEYLVIIIMGGMGSIPGPIFGVMFLVVLNEFVRICAGFIQAQYHLSNTIFGDIRIGVYALVIIFFLIYEADGVYGRWVTVKKYFLNWPFKN
ncbi:MAG: branched-chain amino acid ABC transporter permease [Thermodesulfobacteriota bacterium]|nr:branched-chain amino acid ABC transporter permease [Thermodesulfobacteriota bacterium]